MKLKVEQDLVDMLLDLRNEVKDNQSAVEVIDRCLKIVCKEHK
jgi:hypothetical protein